MVKASNFSSCSAIAVELPVSDGTPPEWVQLMPMGTSYPRNGTPPVVILADRAHAEQVVSASTAYHGPNDMVIDYDHQTVRAPAVAGKAPAAAWIKQLEARDDGIWGRPEWTPQASADLAARRYRYLSPYFAYQPGGRVTKIINAGLTNTPNLDLAAVASAIPENAMIDLKAIASALGLGEAADEAAILAAIASLNAGNAILSATAGALGAKNGDDLVALASATAAKAANPDPALFVPVTVVTGLRAEMSALSTRIDDLTSDRKAAMIAQAMENGRLTPALKAHAETLEEKALASFLAVLPETALGKALLPGGKAADENGKNGLTDEERAVASSMGLSVEEFVAAKKEEAE